MLKGGSDVQPRGSEMHNQGGRGCATKGVGDVQPRGSGMHNQGGRGCAIKGVVDAQSGGSGKRCANKGMASVYAINKCMQSAICRILNVETETVIRSSHLAHFK